MDFLDNDVKKQEDYWFKRLKARYLQGSFLICPKCKRKGNFNSIVLITIDYILYKKRFLVCGWCGKVTEEQENK